MMSENTHGSTPTMSDNSGKPDLGNPERTIDQTTGESASGDRGNSRNVHQSLNEFNSLMEILESEENHSYQLENKDAAEAPDKVSESDDEAEQNRESGVACNPEDTGPDTAISIAECDALETEPLVWNEQDSQQWTESVNPAEHIKEPEIPDFRDEPVPKKFPKYIVACFGVLFIAVAIFTAVGIGEVCKRIIPLLVIDSPSIDSDLGFQGFESPDQSGDDAEITKGGIQQFSVLPLNLDPAEPNSADDNSMQMAGLNPVRPANPLNLPPFAHPEPPNPFTGNGMSGSESEDSSCAAGNPTPSESGGSEISKQESNGPSVQHSKESSENLLPNSGLVSEMSEQIDILKCIVSKYRNNENVLAKRGRKSASESESNAGIEMKVTGISHDGLTVIMRPEKSIFEDVSGDSVLRTGEIVNVR